MHNKELWARKKELQHKLDIAMEEIQELSTSISILKKEMHAAPQKVSVEGMYQVSEDPASRASRASRASQTSIATR